MAMLSAAPPLKPARADGSTASKVARDAMEETMGAIVKYYVQTKNKMLRKVVFIDKTVGGWRGEQ